MKEAIKGKQLSCFEDFGKGNCDCCLDALECERRTFNLKNGVIVLES